MAQDQGQQGYDGANEPGGRVESSVWPWIALAIVVLVVIFFLWLFWRQPLPSSETTVSTPQSTVILPAAKPEATPSEPAADTFQTSSVKLVPNVLGRPNDSGVRALENAGYVVRVTEVHSASRASGLVIGQEPMGGAELAHGGVVTIAVSARAQAVKQVKMPDVVGLKQSSAESKVKAVGLVPYIMYGRVGVPEGQVISQWPLGGELLPVGAEGFIQVQRNP